MLSGLGLQELRDASELTQATLVETMESDQDEISKLERRADMLVSTLRRYVEAMGGRLDIVATFPDEEVRILNLGELAVRRIVGWQHLLTGHAVVFATHSAQTAVTVQSISRPPPGLARFANTQSCTVQSTQAASLVACLQCRAQAHR